MKPLQVVRVDSDDGDTHFVFIELEPLEKNNCDPILSRKGRCEGFAC